MHVVKQLARITVAAAGTAQPLSATKLIASSVIIQADHDNTGLIYVGDEDVDSTHTLAVLEAGDALEIDSELFDGNGQQYNLGQIYVDASVSSDKVRVGYTEES